MALNCKNGNFLNAATISKMDIKVEANEEPCLPDFKVKSEIVTIGSDCDRGTKTEVEVVFPEVPVMGYSTGNNGNDLFEPKFEIKEEPCRTEATATENLCIYDDIEDETNEDIYATESLSLGKNGISIYASDICSNEDLGNNIIFNLRKDSCENARKCQGKENNVADMFSVDTNTCSGMPGIGNVVGIASCLKQNNFLQQNYTNMEGINRENCNSVLSNECRKVYKCEVCEKDFKHQSSLKRHKMIHEGKKPHKCYICNEDFTDLEQLGTHKLIHKAIKPHKCNICKKSFAHLQLLKKHQLIHEGTKPHRCNICNIAFTHLQNLNRHKLIHKDIKPHKCNICDKRFTRSQHLKRHILVHEEIKPHKCNICNESFTRLQHLKTHKFIHEGIKPHKCNICNLHFTRLQYLKRHKLIHEGIKPHKCNVCNKAFTLFQHLKTHKLIHEGIKPYKCDICNKAFNQLSNLKTHKLIHKNKKPQ